MKPLQPAQQFLLLPMPGEEVTGNGSRDQPINIRWARRERRSVRFHIENAQMETVDMETGGEIAGPDGPQMEDGLAQVHKAAADNMRDRDDGSCRVRQLDKHPE